MRFKWPTLGHIHGDHDQDLVEMISSTRHFTELEATSWLEHPDRKQLGDLYGFLPLLLPNLQSVNISGGDKSDCFLEIPKRIVLQDTGHWAGGISNGSRAPSQLSHVEVVDFDLQLFAPFALLPSVTYIEDMSDGYLTRNTVDGFESAYLLPGNSKVAAFKTMTLDNEGSISLQRLQKFQSLMLFEFPCGKYADTDPSKDMPCMAIDASKQHS